MSRTQWIALLSIAVLGCAGAAGVYVTKKVASGASNGACIADLALDDSNTCVLFKDGKLRCFGDGPIVGTGITDPLKFDTELVKLDVPVRAIAAFAGDACALDGVDSSMWCWGKRAGKPRGAYDPAVPAKYGAIGTRNATIAVSFSRFCTLKGEASVVCFNPHDETVTEVAKDVSSLVMGGYFGCLITKAGETQCWGGNAQGELGRGTLSSNASPEWSEPLARVESGQKRFTTIRTSGYSACALTATNALYCWGLLENAQLNDGKYWEGDPGDHASYLPFKHPSPELARLPFDVADFVMGGALCAIALDGSVWCWGDVTDFAKLDVPYVQATRNKRTVRIAPAPVKISELGTDNVRLFTGGWHYCVQKKDGSYSCWGNNMGHPFSRKNEPVLGVTPLEVVCSGNHL